MKTIPEIVVLAQYLKEDYFEVIDEMYHYINGLFGKNLKEIYRNAENYLAASLLSIAIVDKNILDIEIQFLDEVINQDDSFLFSDYYDYNNYNDEQKQEFEKRVDEVLKNVPSFVKVAVLADKKKEQNLKIIKPTYSQNAFDFIKRLVNYIKFTDGNVTVEEETKARSNIDPLIDFFKSQRAKYAPERKED